MLTRMTRMARMLTHMFTRMTRWLAGSHIIHTHRVRASPRCPWSASFPKMIKYFVKKKKTLNNERYRDLLISILSYDEVSAFLLRVKRRN